MGGHSSSSSGSPGGGGTVKQAKNTLKRNKPTVVEKIVNASPTLRIIKGIGERLAEGAKEHNLARRKKHIAKYNKKVPPTERINMTDEEISSEKGLKTLREETAYKTNQDIIRENRDDGGNKDKSIVQPKVASQMDNTGVKSKLIVADKIAPTNVEMAELTDDERMIKVKRGRKTKTVLTKDYEEKPTLSKKVLLA